MWRRRSARRSRSLGRRTALWSLSRSELAVSPPEIPRSHGCDLFEEPSDDAHETSPTRLAAREVDRPLQLGMSGHSMGAAYTLLNGGMAIDCATRMPTPRPAARSTSSRSATPTTSSSPTSQRSIPASTNSSRHGTWRTSAKAAVYMRYSAAFFDRYLKGGRSRSRPCGLPLEVKSAATHLDRTDR